MDPKMEWMKIKNKLLTGKYHFLILLLVGMLLVVIAMPVKENGAEGGEEAVRKKTEESKADYESEMEEKLSGILSGVQGVGDNRVMITLRSTAEKVVEKDAETSEETRRETTVYHGGMQKEEEPYVKKEMTPKIEGVVVIAEGGDNSVVVKNITEAVQTLFGIDTHKIKVMKMNE